MGAEEPVEPDGFAGTTLPTSWRGTHRWRLLPRASPPKRTGEERLHDFDEIYSLFDEKTIREQASRCIQCASPQCRTGCPLANRIPEWLALAAEGDFLGAAEICHSTSNMPEICSRVCPQERLCEGACILNARAEPVCIGAIEKFVNEYALRHEAISVTSAPTNGFQVAVIGSGPGGLACADELAKEGYGVTIFEAQQQPGGLLMNGIPGFKLEKDIVQRRVDLLRKRGVIFRMGVRIGDDLTLAELRAQFDAVFLAFGAQKAKELDVPGSELRGIYQALPFLVQKNGEPTPDLPSIELKHKKVAVLGGGDTAMDCLRTALRCGASQAVCIYRRDLENMPGNRREYANALEEGAEFLFLTNPTALVGNVVGEVVSVRCVRMELGQPDASGRRKPMVVQNSEFDLPADVVLVAYGFDAVPLGKAFAGLEVDEWNRVIVDSNQMTNLPGVFSGGDLARGPSLVVHAVRDGRRAAEAIDRYLSTAGVEKAVEAPVLA